MRRWHSRAGGLGVCQRASQLQRGGASALRCSVQSSSARCIARRGQGDLGWPSALLLAPTVKAEHENGHRAQVGDTVDRAARTDEVNRARAALAKFCYASAPAASDCRTRAWTEYRGNSSVRFYTGDCSTCSQHRVLAAHTRCRLRDGQYRHPRVHGARARAWSKRRRRREPRHRARGTVGDSQQLLRARNKRKSARPRQRQHHRSQPSARRTPTSTAR